MSSSRTPPARSRATQSPNRRAKSRPAPPPSALERWRERALAVPGDVLSASVPLPVLLAEAGIVARFFEARWEATAEHPGLESAANESLTAATGQEVLSLLEAVTQAGVDLRLLPDPPPSPAAEARQALRAILATLAWHLDNGDDAGGRARLDALRAAQAKMGRRSLALAEALEELARFAEGYRAAIVGVGGFDPRQIDEALALARALRERALAPRRPPEAREVLGLRNKLVALLRERIATVRAAARFVFRDHPAIIREVTSAHERKRRKRSRGNANTNAKEQVKVKAKA
jgi:hypothetical protein